MTTISLPVRQFRSIPAPVGSSRFGMFFCAATDVPTELWDWHAVNPREVNTRSSVYKSIVNTLSSEPSRFHERNRGITIVAKDVQFDDKKQTVLLELDNVALHGVVDGAHTLNAILTTQKTPPDAWTASVFFKIVVGADSEQIAEIAGGLNTSQQVDLKSLENLKDHFEKLKIVLSKEKYADDIAYKMNEDKPVDVREILYYLAIFDCSVYNEKTHPVALFGRKEGIVRRFAEQAKGSDDESSFEILIPRAPDILKLRDQIEKAALALDVGRYKVKPGVRIRSESNRGNRLVFLDETVDGKIPLGWIMPMLAAFRANVEWDVSKRKFTWIIDPTELLDACVEELVLGIQDVHAQENSRPEYVGRNSIAWRMSYNTVSQAILGKQLAVARKTGK